MTPRRVQHIIQGARLTHPIPQFLTHPRKAEMSPVRPVPAIWDGRDLERVQEQGDGSVSRLSQRCFSKEIHQETASARILTDIYSPVSHSRPCLNQLDLAKTLKIAPFIPSGSIPLAPGINSRRSCSELGDPGTAHSLSSPPPCPLLASRAPQFPGNEAAPPDKTVGAISSPPKKKKSHGELGIELCLGVCGSVTTNSTPGSPHKSARGRHNPGSVPRWHRDTAGNSGASPIPDPPCRSLPPARILSFPSTLFQGKKKKIPFQLGL